MLRLERGNDIGLNLIRDRGHSAGEDIDSSVVLFWPSVDSDVAFCDDDDAAESVRIELVNQAIDYRCSS